MSDSQNLLPSRECVFVKMNLADENKQSPQGALTFLMSLNMSEEVVTGLQHMG